MHSKPWCYNGGDRPASQSSYLTLRKESCYWLKTMLFTSFDIKGTIYFEFIWQGQTVNQAYYVETLKWLHEAVHRESPKFVPVIGICNYDIALVHKALSVKQFLAQKSITEIGTFTLFPLFNYKWLVTVSKNNVCLKGMKISGFWRHLKKCDSGTESCSTTGVPKMFLTVAASFG